MSRRTLSSAALAAALLTSGLTPLLGTAHADNCATWTDGAGDSRPPNTAGVAGVPGSDNLDIVRTSVQTIEDKIVVTIQLKNLSETGYEAAGDKFESQMTLGGTNVFFSVTRAETGVTAQVKGPGTGTATYALVDNSVVISTTQAELDKAAGKATKDLEAKGLATTTWAQANGTAIGQYDGSQARADVVYIVGAQCSPVVLPPAPLKLPSAGCNTLTDGTGDAVATVRPNSAVSQPVGSNEPALDMAGVSINTTPTKLIAFIHVPGLTAKAPYNGDAFWFGFAVPNGNPLGHFVDFKVERRNSAVRGENATVLVYSTETLVAVSATFDFAKKFVILSIDRASFEELAVQRGLSIPTNGTTVFDVRAVTRGITAPGVDPAGFEVDIVSPGEAKTRTYTIGESPCFEPTVSKLTNLGPASIQFGDVLDVSAKLTSATDQPFANKSVKFTLGSVSTTATTDAEGVATAKLTPTASAGTHNLVISFAGDPDTKASTATKQITVSPEVSGITLTVKKSGTKRTVTAKLAEDDGKAIAGQVVTWFVNGKKISAPKTNSGGIVTISTAKAGQTVKAVFAGVTDKYAGSDASTKLT